MADAFRPFSACHFRLKRASEPWEREGAAALRRRVFCEEQRIFVRDDRDALDEAAIHLVALSSMAVLVDEVVGTVRIHEAEPGLWTGSRLAVDPAYRRIGVLGTALIRLAVGTAASAGCLRFTAHVQAQNELMFRRLGWQRLASVALHGVPHVLMQADLSAYPPLADAPEGFHAVATGVSIRAAA